MNNRGMDIMKETEGTHPSRSVLPILYAYRRSNYGESKVVKQFSDQYRLSTVYIIQKISNFPRNDKTKQLAI